MLKLPLPSLSFRRSSVTAMAFLSLLPSVSLLGAVPARAQTSGTWTSAPNMSVGRYSPAVVSLPDGKVLVASGHSSPGETPSAQIYSPTTKTWETSGPVKRSRNFAVTLLVDENGDNIEETPMIFGGFNSSYGTLNTAERYDTATRTFAFPTYQSGRKTYQSNMTSARELYTATKLPSGRILLVGGFKTFNWYGGGTLKTAEIYDPRTKRFSATGSMSPTGTAFGRFGHDALLIPGTSKVLIVGGKERRTNSDWRSLRSIEIYDETTGVFTHVADMTHRRDRVTLAWIAAEKKVLMVGGKTEAPGEPTGDVLPCEWFDPATNTVSEGPSLSQGRMAHTLTKLTDGGIVAVGGWTEKHSDGTRRTTNSAERLTVSNGVYSFVSAGDALYDTFDHGAAALPSGSVLIVGGKQMPLGDDSSAPRYFPARAEVYTP